MTKIRNGPIILNTPCKKCEGTGVYTKYPCLTCRGQGFEQIQERREIDLPRGIKKGHNLHVFIIFCY